MTLLTVVQQAAVLCNLPQPSSVIASTDPNTPILLALANQEGQELSRRHDWSSLTIEDFTFLSTATEEQTNATTIVGFGRLLPNPELWNQSSSQKYTGPISAREWVQLQSLAITTGSPGWWRLASNTTTVPFGPTIWIFPAPTAGETLAIPVVSEGWAANSSSGSFEDQWLSDADYALIPERLMTLGLIWRYKKTKGLDYAEDMATYEREVERACTRDRGANVLKLRKYRTDDFDWPTWPGTVVP